MTPQTPAGRALLESAWSPDWTIEVSRTTNPDGTVSVQSVTVKACLDAIEREAKQQERERIRALCDSGAFLEDILAEPSE